MFDMIPFTSTIYNPAEEWDPFREFVGTVTHSAATDITEKDDAFIIETELPGYDKSEISVNLKEGVLTLKAEHREEHDEEKDGKTVIRKERTRKMVERRFEVSGVDTAGIHGEYVNGVLKLTLPKLPEVVPQQQQIEIQ